ncbi:MAG: hypothetical protein Q4F34_05525 [Prevotellaceae bacterium]|nr:hypothetical protein [Prevotellaceae bacterium]
MKHILILLLSFIPMLALAQENIHIDAGNARIDFMGYGQSTFTVDNTNDEEKNAFKVERVILMTDAHITPNLEFFLMVDAASQDNKRIMHEYWGQYTFHDALSVKFGQYKMPFTIENPISPTAMGNIYFHEGMCYMVGCGGDPTYGSFAGRDFGLTLSGSAFPASDGHYKFTYYAGVFNGTGMNQTENNTQKDVILRADYQPVKNITLSTSAYLGTGHAIAADPYGHFNVGDDYKRQRWAIGGEANLDKFYLRSEYIRGWNEGTPMHSVYAEAWLKLFRLPKQQNIDVVLDYEYFDKNIFISDATRNYMGGLQWWFHKQCRVSSLFQLKDPINGSITRRWVTQLQLRF